MSVSTIAGRQWVSRHWTLQGMGLTLLAFMSCYPAVFHYQEYLFFVLLCTAIGVAIFQGNAFWIRSPIDLPLALLVGWILLTIPFSVDPGYSFAEWRKLVAHVLVFYWAMLVLENCVGRDCGRYTIWAMLVGVSIISIYGVWYFIHNGGTLVDRDVRAIAPYSGSPWLATYAVLALPFGIACYVQSQNHWEKLLLGGICGLTFLAGVLAYSRGAWLALAVMGLGYGVLRRNRRTFVWGMLSVVAIVSVLFGISRLGYLQGVFVASDSIADRLACSWLAVEDLKRHPVVGVGFGTEIFGQLHPVDPRSDCKGNHSHNTFVLYAMGSGALALIVLLWTFVVIITKLSHGIRVGSRNEAASIKLAGALMAVGYSVAVSSNDLFTGSLACLFWMLVAVGFSLPCQEERFDSPRSS
ncbi:MAG: O-antigen ligase family protein [Nitrospira sp.]|nr:O-antigen ligase family protein [Nitrospira sp.]